YDYNDKKDNYIKYGVKELWLVDLLKDKITTYTNIDKTNPVETKYTFSDKIKSTLFPDLTIDFTEILKMVDKSELDWIK
ncbi:MAG: Uma2 family endonuclease, partial [Oscillospiraceae bacterium]|nr:Uma2 family endonuclease [Oscillospiraceae bacterium]